MFSLCIKISASNSQDLQKSTAENVKALVYQKCHFLPIYITASSPGSHIFAPGLKGLKFRSKLLVKHHKIFLTCQLKQI